MFKRGLLLLIVVTAFITSDAQVKKKIGKGRRNKSQSQFELGANDLEVEWEAGYETINSQLSNAVYPNVVVHYGISDRFEVNTEMSIVTAIDKSVSPQQNTTGIEPVLIGANYQLIRDTGYIPSVIIATQLAIPFLATKNFYADHLAPVVQVNIQESIHDKFTFGLNNGIMWDGFSPTPQFIYDASASYTLTKKWMFTTECFGFIGDEPPQNNLDASMAYVLNDYVQFGFTGGFGISSAAHKSYFAVNGTWGLNTARKKHLHNSS